MFKTLLIKEWKDKALLVAFGLGIMGLMLASFLLFGNDQDLRELIPATFLIFFFPVIGAMLGAGAFESEFRDGAWTYLLSRPVRKETIWSAKLVALLLILAGFWLVFIGLMAVVPGLGDVIAGFNFPKIVGSGLSLFPLILLSSLFFFSIAFSFSILTDKQLSLVFGSLFLGFVLESVLFFFAFQAVGRAMLTHAGQFPTLGAFILSLVLSSLAFLAASLLTFLKTDFSQPNRKTRALAIWCLLFLAAAWALSAAWPVLRPGPKEELDGGIWVVGKEAFLSTNRGLYRYDAESDRFKKIIRLRSEYPHYVTGGGKVLYVLGYDRPEGPALWVANTDGSGKRLLVGGGGWHRRRQRGQGGTPVYIWFQSILLSPDGKTAALLYEEASDAAPREHKTSLASIGTDGTGLTKLSPPDPRTAGNGEEFSWGAPLAWLESPDGLLIVAYPPASPRQARPTGLWRYDLASGAQAKLFESPRIAGFYPDPTGKSVLMVTRKNISAGPVDVSLLDLATGTETPVTTIERSETPLWPTITSIVWSADGDKIAFLARQAGGLLRPAVYLLKERRLVLPDDVQVHELLLWASLDWTADGLKLVLADPAARSLQIMGPDLDWKTTMAVPASMSQRFRARPVGDAVLVSDPDNEAVWRLDLKTEKWKKVW